MVPFLNSFLNIFQFDNFYRYEYNNARPATTHNDREGLRDLNRRAQREWWKANLRILNAKKKIVEKNKVELERDLKTEFDSTLESTSELGAGYVDYTFQH